MYSPVVEAVSLGRGGRRPLLLQVCFFYSICGKISILLFGSYFSVTVISILYGLDAICVKSV